MHPDYGAAFDLKFLYWHDIHSAWLRRRYRNRSRRPSRLMRTLPRPRHIQLSHFYTINHITKAFTFLGRPGRSLQGSSTAIRFHIAHGHDRCLPTITWWWLRSIFNLRKTAFQISRSKSGISFSRWLNTNIAENEWTGKDQTEEASPTTWSFYSFLCQTT